MRIANGLDTYVIIHVRKAVLPHHPFKGMPGTKLCACICRGQIAAERARALDLRERLAALRATVAQQRRAMGGVNAARDGDLQARRVLVSNP